MEQAVFILEIIGTVAFTLSGVMTAIEKRLDLLGVVVLGTVTAVGGGGLRDVLLGILPPMLFRTPIYVTVAVVVSLLAFAVAYLMGDRFTDKIERLSPMINVLDAVGLGVFVVVGVRAAIQIGFAGNAFLSVFVGTVTGVGGGLMRDQLAGLIPMVLQKRVYAIAALLGAIAYYVLVRCGVIEWVCLSIGVGLVILIRLLAAHFLWSLPRIGAHAEKAAEPSKNKN